MSRTRRGCGEVVRGGVGEGGKVSLLCALPSSKAARVRTSGWCCGVAWGRKRAGLCVAITACKKPVGG